MEPRCNHLGNQDPIRPVVEPVQASMEPRCNHLGNVDCASPDVPPEVPQWSPGVITWETGPPGGSRPGGPGLNGAQV